MTRLHPADKVSPFDRRSVDFLGHRFFGASMAQQILIVQSKVKATAKKLKVRLSAKAVGALSTEVENAIKRAAGRAKANKRKTIQEQDV